MLISAYKLYVTDPFFFEGATFYFLIKNMLISAYELYVTQSNYINETETETNDAQYLSSLVISYNKSGVLFSPFAIHWLLSRGYFVIRDVV